MKNEPLNGETDGNELYYMLKDFFGEDFQALDETYAEAMRAMEVINDGNEFGSSLFEYTNNL